MKAAIILCFVALAATAMARPEETYTSHWDNIDIPEVLANKKLMHSYVDCCMGRGKCTPEGKELKSHIAEALKTECAKCTEAQKKGVEQVIAHLINNMPEAWAELTGKYDPTGEYSKKYEERSKKLKA